MATSLERSGPSGAYVRRIGRGLAFALVQSGRPSPGVLALVVAEDTYLILDDSPPVLRSDPRAPSARAVAARAARELPVPPGTVQVCGGAAHAVPYLMRAVVYDFSSSPYCREEFVYAALVEVFSLAKRGDVRALAFRPLGTGFGGISANQFLRLLLAATLTAAEVGVELERVEILVETALEFSLYRGELESLLG
jgi:hypothetical protein